MPSNGGNITFGINFNVDKSGLDSLKKSLQDIQKATTQDLVGSFNSGQAQKALQDIKKSASDVEQALSKAYNPTLNTTNISKFNQELKTSGTNLNQVYQNFSKLGTQGQAAFTKLASNVLTTNVKLKQTNNILDQMGTTLINTAKWSVASSVMNTFTGSIQNAFNYVKALDSSLTDIRIVTGDSRAEMDQFAESANRAAQALGRQTKEYTNAALSFYQQGLSDEEVAARTETTLKASNITGADVSTMADQLTAVWNGFQIVGQDTNDVVSKLAAVADSSASNMSELATAMSKVASVANNMGVDVDQLNAQIATIIATTRQAPETVGNALKTIYARINDIKAGTDEAQISLGNYTGKMASLGVNVLDTTGHLRDTGQVMEEIGSRWGTMTREQQIYLAQTMAGQRQMNNLIALFDNWNMYTKELNVSLEAQGTLDEKNAIAMESLSAHMKQLEAASEGLTQAFFNGDSFKGFVDAGTGALNLLTNLVEAIGGGGNAILALGSIFTSVFSGVISQQINKFVVNLQNARFNQEQLNEVIENTNRMAAINGVTDNSAVSAMVEKQSQIQQYYSIMSEGEINHYNNLVRELGLATQQHANWDQKTKDAKEYAKQLLDVDENIEDLSGSLENGQKISTRLEVVIRKASKALNEANQALDEVGDTGDFDKLYKSLTKVLEATNADEKAVNELNAALKDVDVNDENAVAQAYTKAQEVIDDVTKKIRQQKEVLEDNGNTVRQTKAAMQDYSKQLDQVRDKNAQAFEIKNITQTISAIGQLTSSLQSLANIPTIWNDENLSGGQKFLRIVGSLAMTLPMLYSSLSKVAEATGLADTFVKAYTQSKMAHKAAQEASTAATEVNSAANAKNTVSEQMAAAAQTKGALSALEQGEANIADAQAKAANAAATAALKLAVLGVAAAVAIGVVAYRAYVAHIKKVNEQNIKQRDAAIQAQRAKQEQIEQNIKLGKSYLDIYDQYKNGTATKEQLIAVTESLGDAYDQEAIKIAQLTGNYDRLAESVSNTLLKQLKEARDTAEAIAKEFDDPAAFGSMLQEEGGATKGSFGRKGNYIIDLISGQAGQEDVIGQVKQRLAKYGLQTQYLGYDLVLNFDPTSTMKDVAQAYDAIEKFQQDLKEQYQKDIQGLSRDSKQFQQIDYEYRSTLAQSWYTALDEFNKGVKDSVTQYKAAMDQVLDYDAKIATIQIGFNNIQDIQTLEQKKQALIKALKEIGYAQDELNSKADALIVQYGDIATNNLLKRVSMIDAFFNQNATHLLEGTKNAIKNFAKDLSDEELTVLFNLDFDSLPSDLDAIKAALNQALEQIEGESVLSLSGIIQQISDTLLTSGKLGDKDLESLRQQVDQLGNLTEEDRNRLGIILDENGFLRDQIELIQTLRQSQKEANDLSGENLLKQTQKEIEDKINQLQEERRQLNNYLSDALFGEVNAADEETKAEFEAKVKYYQQQISDINAKIADEKARDIVAETADAFTEIDLKNLSADLQTAKQNSYLLAEGAKLIGSDYKVAAEDVSALLNIFPQILDGLDPLEDGSFQLTKEIVQNALKADQEIVESDQKALAAKLFQRKKELEAVKQMSDAERQEYAKVVAAISELNATASGSLEKAQYATEGLGGDYTPKNKDDDDGFDFQGLMAKIFELRELTDDEQLAWSQGLDQLLEKYPELRDQIELLRNTTLSSTTEYQKALRQIQDLLDQIKLDEAIEKAEEFGEKFEEFLKIDDDNNFFNINTDSLDEFFETLSGYTQAEYTIDIQVQTQAEKAFDQIEQTFNNIEKAASSIGQSWTIQGDKIREINSVFPGILEGMQAVGDGSYQLSQEVAQNAINAATAQAAAEADSIRSRLQDQSALLHSKAQIYTRMAEAAQVLANSEIHTEQEADDARATLSASLSELKQKNSELATIKENQDQQAVAESSRANGQVTAQNWAEAANSSAQSIYAFAQNACDNMKAVAEGGTPTPPPQITANYGGAAGVSVEAAAINTAESAIDNADTSPEVFQAMVDQFRALASASESAANDIDGMLAQIGANANKIADGINNLNAGRKFDDGTSKKSGGGGGSKSKDKTADQIEKLKLKDSDVDKYHQIERAISRIDDYLDAMSGYQEKAIRGAKSDTIDKEVNALEQQKALYERKIQMMKADLQLQQANLSALGVQFDEQGNIINYTALMSAYQMQYNALLEQAKLLTGDAQSNKLKQAEALKTQLENLKSQMGAYESLQDKIMDAGSAIRDIIDKEEQLRIKQFKIKIDTELDFAEAKRDWNKFKKEVIDKIQDDDYLGQAKARLQDFYSYYDEAGNGIIQQLTEHVEKTRREAEIIENGGTSSVYGKNQAQALEDLKNYTDELMQNLEDVQEIAKDIHDLYLDTIDKAQDAFDEQIDQYEQVSKIIEHDMNLLQMLSPEDNEEQLAQYYNMLAKNHNEQIDFYRREADMWKAQMDNAKQGTEEWKQFRDNWEAAITDLNSAVETAVENLLSKYENTISKIIKSTKNQILGGDWQAALDEWDRAKWNDDRYLDLGSRATGVLDFVDKVNDAMNKQSPRVQKQLADFLDKQVGDLNNITNLRQIDLDIAYKKLEVLQKQMALEDAQNAKTRMRLRRDSQGNYTYQYVADEDEIATKQQQLRDTLEELRQLAKVDISDTMDEVEDKLQEFFERAQQLSETYYDDQEELQERLLALQEEYFGEEGYITKLGLDYNNMQTQLLEATGAQFSVLLTQMGDELFNFLGLDSDSENDKAVWGSIKALMDPDGGKIPTLFDAFVKDVFEKNFALMSKENQDLLFGSGTGFNPSWNTALGNMAQMYVTMTEEYIIPCMQAMIDANAVYANDLMLLQQVAGVSFSNIAAGLDADIAYTQALIQNNGVLIDTYNSQINAIAAVCAQIQALCGQYAAAEQAAIAAANAALKFWFAANGQVIGDYYSSGYGGGTGAVSSAPVAKTTSGGTTSSGSGTSKTSSGESSGSNTYYMVKDPTSGMAQFYEYNGNFNTNTSKSVDYNTAMKGNVIDANMTYKKKTTTYAAGRSNISRFATGGYTGEWSDGDGRLAILHQKELVLNADDTQNMLSAVKIASGIIEKVAGLNSSVFDNIVAGRGLSGIDTSRTVDSSTNQDIKIYADFPNANSADEIRQALGNLVNIASQRASNNRRTY